jgi:peptidoglycan LD-endopeptidase LytH
MGVSSNLKKISRHFLRNRVKTLFLSLLMILIVGFLLPERMIIPVLGATTSSWNHHSFWYKPWGKSGVHRGIDIFAKEGTPVIAATGGLVLCAHDSQDAGGNIVVILGPKWRAHYYAHLKDIKARAGRFVSAGEEIGTVGRTGNAINTPPHLHYAIITQIPYPWRYAPEKYGFDRMFFLNPHEKLINH